MKGVSIEERAVNLAHYIIETKDTVRGAAKKFGVSKSTVHTDVTLWNGLKIGQAMAGVLAYNLAENNENIKFDYSNSNSFQDSQHKIEYKLEM